MTDTDHSHHIVPVKYYLGVFGFLLFMTFVTVFVAQFDFGTWNIIIAMVVAVLKATAVSLIFMGLLWDKGFNRIVMISAFVFLGIFIGFSVADVFTRKSTDPLEATTYNIKSPVKPVDESHCDDSHH